MGSTRGGVGIVCRGFLVWFFCEVLLEGGGEGGCGRVLGQWGR